MSTYTIPRMIDVCFEMIVSFTKRILLLWIDAGVPQPKLHSENDVETQEKNDEMLPHTFRTIQDILKVEKNIDVTEVQNTILYVCEVNVSMYENPTIEFDTQVGVVPYGEAVTMHEARGRFFHVTWNGLTGWVLRDDLADRVSRVYPEFRVGQEHSVDHPHTAQVRAILGNEFGVGRSEFPLQSGEYVVYKLWRKGIRIQWPDIRPRVPGLWHTILKGLPQVHMGVMPKVGTVMEYMLDTDVGHVAYVEAVFPDDTISISEVNFPDSGIYNERILTKEEWKSLKPIFIQFS